jgi:FkbM family methyltransferase
VFGKGFIKRVFSLKSKGFPLHYALISLLDYEVLRRTHYHTNILILPNGFKVLLPIRYQSIRRGILYNYSEIFIYSEYLKVPEYRVQEGDIVVDAGAFVGLYTLSVADKASLVIAIEPNVASYIFLTNNIKINNLNSKTITYNVALGDFEGSAILYVEDWLASSSTLFDFWHIRYGHSLKIPVKVVKLDNILKNVGIDKVDLMKIDVEGAELMVLRGAIDHLKRHLIKRLVVEIHLDVVSVKEVRSYLEKYGYKMELFEIRGDTALVYSRC